MLVVEECFGLGGSQNSSVVFSATDCNQCFLLYNPFGLSHVCWPSWQASACRCNTCKFLGHCHWFRFHVVLDRVKWSSRNISWSRIWCQTIHNVGNASTSLLHNIILLLYYHIVLLALLEPILICFIKIPVCQSKQLFMQSISFVFTELIEVSSGTIHRHATVLFISPNVHSFRHCICSSSLNIPWF